METSDPQALLFQTPKTKRNGLLRSKNQQIQLSALSLAVQAFAVNGNIFAAKLLMVNVAIYLQHQGHPDEKDHESIKHTPAILDIGVIPLCRVKPSKRRQKGKKRE